VKKRWLVGFLGGIARWERSEGEKSISHVGSTVKGAEDMGGKRGPAMSGGCSTIS